MAIPIVNMVTPPCGGVTTITNFPILKKIQQYAAENSLGTVQSELMLVLTGCIYKKHLETCCKSVEMPSCVFQDLLGREYTTTLKHCLKSVILIDKNHSSDLEKCRSFRFRDGIATNDPFEYEIKTFSVKNRFEKRKKSRENKAKNLDILFGDNRQYNQNEAISHLAATINESKIEPFLKEIAGVFKNDETLNQNRSYLYTIANKKVSISLPDKNGRIYNEFIQLKREARNILGSEWCSLDISSSHFFILGVLLECIFNDKDPFLYKDFVNKTSRLKKGKIKYDNNFREVEVLLNSIFKERDFIKKYLPISLSKDSFESELKKLKEGVSNGKFYSNILEEEQFSDADFKKLVLVFKRDTDKYALFKSKTSFSQEEKTQIIKKCCLSWLNGLPNKGKHKLNAKSILTKKYPLISLVINCIKLEESEESERHDNKGKLKMENKKKSKMTKQEKVLFSTLTLIESNFIFSTIDKIKKELDISVISIHDCFVFETKHKDEVVEIINKQAQLFFGDMNLPNFKLTQF